MEAINNLVQLGFTKERAAEAYFACDKNEEMAANFLFEAGMMDEDQATLNAIAASEAEADANASAANTENANANPPANNNNNEEPKKDEEPDAGAGAGNGEGSSLA
jgi:ubiquitin